VFQILPMKKVMFIFLLLNSLNTMAQQIIGGPAPLPFSKTVSVNNQVFISGQVGIDEATGKLVTGSFETEANQVMHNIGILLKKEGLAFKDLANVTIYLKDMGNYQVTNRCTPPILRAIFLRESVLLLPICQPKPILRSRQLQQGRKK